MISAKSALKAILNYKLSLKIETINLEDSLNRFLAQDIFADADQPPFERVTMDGIAINSANLLTTKKFKILKTISAGVEVQKLPAGHFCFEIMTGAVLPIGADMVIRYEDLKITDGDALIQCERDKLNTNFHPQGSDYQKGQKLLTAGTKIRPSTISILATTGHAKIKVYALPKIAILSTGDELVDIKEVPLPHQIRWSNGLSLKTLLANFGQHNVEIVKVVDDEKIMLEKMQSFINSCDILILTGGVSAGKFDFVPKLLNECLVEEVFHKVSQRPGKPLWFGKTKSNVFVFGLPGNPVSCMVNLRKFIIPFINNSLSFAHKNSLTAKLSETVNFNSDMTYYCLVKLENIHGEIHATPIKGNGSGDLFQIEHSSGFMELDPSHRPFNPGFYGEVYLWGHEL